jgi:predicted permease
MFAIFLRTLAIFLMMLAGFVLRRRGVWDDTFNRQLSLLLVNVFYPALILSSIIRNFTLRELGANWTLPAGVFGIMALGWIVGGLCRPLLRGQPEQTRRCFHFMCAVNNYSFLPIMLVTSLWGEGAVAKVVFASLGAEVFVWTLGVQALTGQRVSARSLRHLVSMPMVALVAAFGVVGVRAALDAGGACVAEAAPPLHATLVMLLDTCRIMGLATVPVSAVICGSRMASLQAHHLATPILAGLAFLRLAAIPALAIGLLHVVPLSADVRGVLTVIAIQPVAMASVSMAEVYDSDSEFSAAAVLVTHVLCLATIPIWLHMALSAS